MATSLEVQASDSPLFLGWPSFPSAYFTGYLFPPAYEDKLHAFYEKTSSPHKLLEEPSRRAGLIEVLEHILPRAQQINLFNMDSQLPALLDELNQQGQFYQRWTGRNERKVRNFAVPQKAFKALLQQYILPFIKSLPVHSCCHGGEAGWSVRKSLETHLPVMSWVCFDMEAAFDQAEINHVFNFLYEHLGRFCQDDEQRVDAAAFLASLCTVKKWRSEGKLEKSGFIVQINNEEARSPTELRYAHQGEYFTASLPIGSPVSAFLFNRMLRPIDAEIERRARKKGMRYSRWVDDFILTSPKRRHFGHFAQVMRIAQESFSIAPNKVFFGYACPAHVLGHEIRLNEITKLDKREFEKRRSRPLTEMDLTDTHPRGDSIYMDWSGDSIEGDEEVNF